MVRPGGLWPRDGWPRAGRKTTVRGFLRICLTRRISDDFDGSITCFDERNPDMTETAYEKPVWSYPDSMGPAIYYGHIPEFNGLIPPYEGRQTFGVGSKKENPQPAAV